eukprot:TRINITY_DN739_c0_g3_i2.p3 TRINITY_DN739_c0_g3~~TRINITY_DN739_c0_g3_i2.p3  ORF type:complete len:101 (-),score=4.39 TRINITY_DN739_c0_g3_i2:18-320(-)
MRRESSEGLDFSEVIHLRLAFPCTCSKVVKWFFMHFIATQRPVNILCALSTSLNVPSPFLLISRYSNVTSYSILFIDLSLIHICRCRRYAVCRSRWSPYH